MLILTRKLNQSIMVGHDIEIIVTEIKGDSVKIGIKAPRSIAVHRREVYDSIMAENINASRSKMVDLEKLGKIIQTGQRSPNSAED